MIIDGLHFVIILGAGAAAAWMLGHAAGLDKGCRMSRTAMEEAARRFADKHGEAITLGRTLIEIAQSRKLHAQFAPDGFTATGQMLATVDGQKVLIKVEAAP